MTKARTPILRTSERGAFGRCPWAWWQRYRLGLVPKGLAGDARWFGTGVHLALAEWYCGPGLKRGRHPAETFAQWAAGEIRHIKTSNRFGTASEALIEEKLVPAETLGTVLMDEYVKHYGRDDSWHIIEPEHSGQLDVEDPFEPGRALVIYAFTYDGVYRDLALDDSLWLLENKTARAISTRHLPLDNQAGSYYATAAAHLRDAKLIGPREQLRGINYNFIRKALPDTRPRDEEGYFTNKPVKADYLAALDKADPRANWTGNAKKYTMADLEAAALAHHITVTGEISKLQPKPLFERHQVKRTAAERAIQIQRIQADALHMEAFRDGYLMLTKTPTRDCSFCDYNALCELDEGGQDTTDYRKAMFRIEDPYADHRKSTEE